MAGPDESFAHAPSGRSDSPGRARWINILPIVFVMYTIAYFDRSNIGLALPYISKDLALTPVQAGLISGAFTWGYAITQFLAGWLTLKLGARSVIGHALWLWGAAAVGTSLARSYEELLVARAMLGLFEGPVFAATAVLLAEWFTKPERGRAFGIWNLSSPTGAFLAGPISGMILAHYDWRIMMFVEGLPAWLWMVLWWWRMPASIKKARWLPAGERASLEAALAEEQSQLASKEKSDKWWTIFAEPSVWLTLIGSTFISQLIAGYQLWLPSLLHSASTLSVEMIGLLSGLPFLAGMLGIILITWHSDRHGQERRWHAAIPTIITGVVLIAAMLVAPASVPAQITLLIAAGFTMKMFIPLVFTRLTETLPRTKAITAVVFVNAVGNLLAGTMGPLIVGVLRQSTNSFDAAFIALGAGAVLGGLLLACVGAKWTLRQQLPLQQGGN
ncbi:MFS transporter [Phytobacter sp. V91]|uniref:MFS transporter n=1 Tax=Phytobacter sp. V91 TaxID=3369425 RepID=UPI003F60DE79